MKKKLTTEDVVTLVLSLNLEALDYILYKVLKAGKVSFAKVSRMYVESLEAERKEKSSVDANASVVLEQFYNDFPVKTKEQIEFLKDKAARWLLNSRYFEGLPFEKELQERIDKLNKKK